MITSIDESQTRSIADILFVSDLLTCPVYYTAYVTCPTIALSFPPHLTLGSTLVSTYTLPFSLHTLVPPLRAPSYLPITMFYQRLRGTLSALHQSLYRPVSAATLRRYNSTLSSSSNNIHAPSIMSFGDKAAARLAGKTVFVTGASSGIGQATVLALAEAAKGDLKFVLAARRTDRLEELKKTLEGDYKGIQVLPFQLDVSKVEETENIVSKLPKEFAEVDVLINNAGMVHGTEKVGAINQNDIEIMFHTNVLGLISVTQQFVNDMRKRNKGDIVNIGSIAGREPYVGGGIYCATKAAVRSFTETLRKETIDTRIRIIEVDPGAVETEFSVVRFRGDKSKADAVYAGTEPLVADDIAEFITYTLTRRENVVIADTLIFPNHQASPTHVYRKN